MAGRKGSLTGRCQGCNHPERVRIERFLPADVPHLPRGRPGGMPNGRPWSWGSRSAIPGRSQGPATGVLTAAPPASHPGGASLLPPADPVPEHRRALHGAFYTGNDPCVLRCGGMAVVGTHLADTGSTAAVPGAPHITQRTVRLVLARLDPRLATARPRTRRLGAVFPRDRGCGAGCRRHRCPDLGDGDRGAVLRRRRGSRWR